MNNSDNSLPLRKCEDCAHDLGDPARALCCPLFGKLRLGVESRCPVFTAKQKSSPFLPNYSAPG